MEPEGKQAAQVGPAELDENVEVMAHGSLWHGFNSAIFKFISFLYTIIIARMVTQDQVGLFYFALGIASLVGIFSDAGMTQAISRYVPYYLGRKDGKSASLAIRVSRDVCYALGVLLAVALYALAGPIAAFFSNPPLEGVLRLMAFYVFAYQIFNITAAWLIAFKKVKEASIGSNIQNAAKLVLTLALILYAARIDAQALAIATIGSLIFAIIYLYVKAGKEIKRLPAEQGDAKAGYRSMAGEMGAFGMTMIFVLLIATLITYTDRLLIGYFLKSDANAQIAIYSIATGLASLVTVLAASIMAIFFPVISELHGKDDMAKMNSASQTALRWILFSSMPVAAFMVAFSAPMLQLLYGAAYEPGWIVLSFFSIGMFASLLGTAQRTALAGMMKLQVERNVAIITFVANFILNAAFIPIWGINGAALASALALVLMAFLNQHYAKKLMGFSFPWSAWKNIAAGAASLIVLLLVETYAYNAILANPIHITGSSIVSLVLDKGIKLSSLLVFFAAGAAIYLALLNFMHLFEREDAAVFKRIMARAGAPPWFTKSAVRLIFFNHREFH